LVPEAVIDDAALAAAARAAGWPRTPAELRDLLIGINAAPPPDASRGWLALVAPGVSNEAAEQLDAVRKALSQAPRPEAPARGERLDALRDRLRRMGLNGFVVPRADEHQSEYLPARAERLAWLTGFTGSAGVAVVLEDRAAVFVDGRYTLQVAQQCDPAKYAFLHLNEDPPTDWVKSNLPKGGKLGYDPWLHTFAWVEAMRKATEEVEGELVPVEDNPIDAVWSDQPPPPVSPVVAHPIAYAGRSSQEKRSEIGDRLAAEGVDGVVLTAPESIAWLLNVRGGDVPNTPLPLCFAILLKDGQVDLFVDRRKLTPGLERHLGNQIALRDPEDLGPALDDLGAAGRVVQADPAGGNAWVFDRLHRATAAVHRESDPCLLPKARKNPAELTGAKAAHARDAVAVCRFLAWLDETAPLGRVTEREAEARLLAFRAEQPLFRGSSFETISAAGPNAAVVHYRVTPDSDRPLGSGTLYLVDSGAQYLDGTTDVTRTVAVGEPTEEMRDRFTRVLKGHIALASVRFPKGTTGSQLDTLARQFLWQAGLDFDHGTGHGVGSYLGVHEGPQRISRMPNTVALEPGMILSNEPGFYRQGRYGIRIENLVAVRPCSALPEADRPMMCFETLTLAPIDRRLIDTGLLAPEEAAWIDAYHRRVRETVTPFVDSAAAQWLADATVPLDGSGSTG
jgi:Xaa-Pro aminopeptidase